MNKETYSVFVTAKIEVAGNNKEEALFNAKVHCKNMGLKNCDFEVI